MAKAISALENQTLVQPARLTVDAFLVEHRLPAIRSSLRELTFRSYEMHVRRYLVPALGALPLRKVTAAHLNQLYTRLLAGLDSRQLQASSVRRVHATAHRALRDTVRWGYIPFNPAEPVELPRVVRAEFPTWTPPGSPRSWPGRTTTFCIPSGDSWPRPESAAAKRSGFGGRTST